MDVAIIVGIFAGLGLARSPILHNNGLDLLFFSYDCEHTDNIPIKTEKHLSNWGLFAAHIANLARMLGTAGFSLPRNYSWKGLPSLGPKFQMTMGKTEAFTKDSRSFVNGVALKNVWLIFYDPQRPLFVNE